jgi:hypothetical protein
MNRFEFCKIFNSDGPIVLPVIHVLDNEQAERNVTLALEGGCAGVFLINHDFGIDPFIPIIKHVRKAFPDTWIALNFLAVTGKDAFPILGELQEEGIKIDGYWGDDARIDEFSNEHNQTEAEEILHVKSASGWEGMYFGGTCFKKQREVAPENYATSAQLATHFMDVVTTSGIATGHAADIDKIQVFRNACGDKPIALASGITPENVHEYSSLVDCLMVATGINIADDFYNIDPERLKMLMNNLRETKNDS